MSFKKICGFTSFFPYIHSTLLSGIVELLYAQTIRGYPSGGSGLVSTTADYLRYTQIMLNGGVLDGTRILSPHTIARMAANHVPAQLLPFAVDRIAEPGKGFGVIMDCALTAGPYSDGTFFWGGAASTNFFIDPRELLTAVLMTQVLNNVTPFGSVFNELVYAAIVENWGKIPG